MPLACLQNRLSILFFLTFYILSKPFLIISSNIFVFIFYLCLELFYPFSPDGWRVSILPTSSIISSSAFVLSHTTILFQLLLFKTLRHFLVFLIMVCLPWEYNILNSFHSNQLVFSLRLS